jgi:hypothetical protein
MNVEPSHADDAAWRESFLQHQEAQIARKRAEVEGTVKAIESNIRDLCAGIKTTDLVGVTFSHSIVQLAVDLLKSSAELEQAARLRMVVVVDNESK